MKRDHEIERQVNRLREARIQRDRAGFHFDAMRAKEQKAATKLNWFMGGVVYGLVGGFVVWLVFG